MTEIPAQCFQCDKFLSPAECQANGVPEINGGREAAALGPRCLCSECVQRQITEKENRLAELRNPHNYSLTDCVSYGQRWPQHQWETQNPDQPGRQTCANCLMTIVIHSSPRIN